MFVNFFYPLSGIHIRNLTNNRYLRQHLLSQYYCHKTISVFSRYAVPSCMEKLFVEQMKNKVPNLVNDEEDRLRKSLVSMNRIC